ncbi:uncharacterized protein LOC126896548 [Daktulosphaira vitifoliae]|uniref:uncharacterized protein LOC126896548 n=1 Tax=Daktulosphaira vitifoliae TaxID=58002 RepID=UPI0021AA8C1A|nr:uncharacterized protein LOC126896548 [Daktulosphaira vitifoliae]
MNELGVQDLMKTLAIQNENESDDEMADSSNEEENEQSEDVIMKNCLEEVNNSSTALMKLRSIFCKIKRSEMLKNRFNLTCEIVGVSTTVSPILDCPTRWNSTHDMLGVTLKLKKGIVTLCNNVPELTDFQISEDKWIIFEKVYKFLINFRSF